MWIDVPDLTSFLPLVKPLTAALAWQDHAVIGLYVLVMLVIGWRVSRRQKTDEDYFLGGRNMPWLAVGISVIASILSSITYVADPGEVWRSGEAYLIGKMLAIPFEMAFVWWFVIPFMMRFRFTSAYEYLGLRFGRASQTLGVAMFLALVVSWMGIVVLVLAKVMSDVTGVGLEWVITTVGVVATVYTMMGGVRAVIWTDVLQVGLMLGGVCYVLGFVAWETDSNLIDWHHSVKNIGSSLPLFSWDPTTRMTVVTVGLSMFCWHVCTHVGNQMTVQRYFCTRDARAARRSFVVGSLLGVVINLLLMVVGMALFHYYADRPLPPEISPELREWALAPAGQRDPSLAKQADSIFPRFVVDALPPGVAGAILAAMLAAAMSTIDSGANSVASVLVVERTQRRKRRGLEPLGEHDHVAMGRWLTLVVGAATTLSAYGLNQITGHVNIVEMMPRSFNCIPGPMGGMFLAGMFIDRAGQRSIFAAAVLGLIVSLSMAYSGELSQQLFGVKYVVGFTWVVFSSLGVTLGAAWLFSRFERSGVDRQGLTWSTRDVSP